ncbi:hypothetical protein JL475_05280 [Streptomyces sp. M2CJ-2]|uniref:hypothetical protein n=1 Tax=Streptomyces sp. M2CJ-2 TaxID=2803948 RepID=UPI001923DA36|nr:hypothetical protein [Streptomyces sp. M2CJ-2]MBL3665423.1 hypothetical protein [Streptomyces sp. M2CJ-2]
MTVAAADRSLLGFPGVGVELSVWGRVLLGAVAVLVVVFALVRIVRLLRQRRR